MCSQHCSINNTGFVQTACTCPVCGLPETLFCVKRPSYELFRLKGAHLEDTTLETARDCRWLALSRDSRSGTTLGHVGVHGVPANPPGCGDCPSNHISTRIVYCFKPNFFVSLGCLMQDRQPFRHRNTSTVTFHRGFGRLCRSVLSYGQLEHQRGLSGICSQPTRDARFTNTHITLKPPFSRRNSTYRGQEQQTLVPFRDAHQQ